MSDRKLLEQALESLQTILGYRQTFLDIHQVMEDLKARLEQPEREWHGLTDEEMLVAAFKAGFDVHEDYDNEDDPDALHWWSEDGERCDDTLHKLRDIIEAKLKEKNGL